MKPRRPISSALMVLLKTVGLIIVVFVVGAYINLFLFGHSQEASWGFAWLMTFFILFALPFGIFRAVYKFLQKRRQLKVEKTAADAAQASGQQKTGQ